MRTLVPKPRELAIFERFLRRYCDKPEGITIALDDRLSEGALAGEDPALVALRHMDGPPQGGGESAYLYVLIFDSRLESRPVPDPPRVLRSCPTAILIDRAWLLAHRKPTIGQRALLAVALVHGAGEVLGLWPEANGRPAGCADRGCVMDRAIFDVSPLDVTLGRASLDEPRLCAPCRARLLAGRAGKAPGNLRFVGPALVRSAQGYYVASLPFYSWLGIGQPKDLAVDELLANAVAYMEQRPGYHARGVSYVDGAVPWPLAPERRKAVAAALRRAARDPDRAVARLARLLERKLRARIESARGG
ncbi:MAG: hypothetical protein D6776_12040 [Planctomycetota bacterium]|nr:MAG: hypothetical protein D6776_12040 [Planctomycetota bacterium]